ncbi:MAG: tripartite tricarboxylate transporter substrate-binding protein [Acidobacteriota bacterium]|nr:tripartite tricarboxylate transporter substrate-binding protein [Acidobacteriota bacterium]
MTLGRAVVLLVLAAAPLDAQSSLTIVAPAAPGGGWDQTARVMQRVLAEIEPATTVQVDNIPGAAGTIGLARFVQSERGHPNALLVTGLVMVSGAIINASPVSLSDATPIARLTGETEVIVVPVASPYTTIGDLIAAFKQDPGGVSWGGGSAGGTDDLLVRLLAEQVGLPASRVNYIAFAGGGAALAAVLGGQVTAAVSGYGEFAGQIAAGQLRPLAISAAERVPGIDAPTLRESGIPLDLANWRALVAPPGLSDAEQDALTARITRLATSDAWRQAVAQNGWDDRFLAGAGFRQFLLAEQARVGAVLQRLATAEIDAPPRSALSVTPTTMPTVTMTIFGLLVAALAASRARSRTPVVAGGSAMRMAALLALALLLQPVVMMAAGFIITSTLLFVVTATAWRGVRPLTTVIARDAIVGAVFTTLIYVIFSTGLGVSLP